MARQSVAKNSETGRATIASASAWFFPAVAGNICGQAGLVTILDDRHVAAEREVEMAEQGEEQEEEQRSKSQLLFGAEDAAEEVAHPGEQARLFLLRDSWFCLLWGGRLGSCADHSCGRRGFWGICGTSSHQWRRGL